MLLKKGMMLDLIVSLSLVVVWLVTVQVADEADVVLDVEELVCEVDVEDEVIPEAEVDVELDVEELECEVDVEELECEVDVEVEV
jgi:hypothetical protein